MLLLFSYIQKIMANKAKDSEYFRLPDLFWMFMVTFGLYLMVVSKKFTLGIRVKSFTQGVQLHMESPINNPIQDLHSLVYCAQLTSYSLVIQKSM